MQRKHWDNWLSAEERKERKVWLRNEMVKKRKRRPKAFTNPKRPVVERSQHGQKSNYLDDLADKLNRLVKE